MRHYLKYVFRNMVALKKKIFLNFRWRLLNGHNDTHCMNYFNYKIVSVGHHTYGPLEVYSYGYPVENLSIGCFVSISPGVKFLLGGNHPYSGFSTYPFKVKIFGEKNEAISKGPVIIQDDVWIGLNSLILSGLTIGKGAVIAAGSVVVKSVPPFAIVAGNPAKVIKYRFPKKIIEQLNQYDYSNISDDFIRKNIQILYSPIDSSTIEELSKK